MTTLSSPPPLAAEELTVERGGVRVLDQVSFSAGPGCLMGVVGPNGAGKSTLFNVIVSLLPATSWTGAGTRQAGQRCPGTRCIRSSVRTSELASSHDCLGRSNAGSDTPDRLVSSSGTRWTGPMTEDALRQVGMWDRRRSLVGRAVRGAATASLCGAGLGPRSADILLLDEAFSGVDIASQEELVSVLTELRDQGRTILMSSHDINHSGPLLRRMSMP